MTRLVQFSNNALSRLAANVTSSGTSISLTPGEGSKFPTLTGTQYFMATLIKGDGTTEIVKVTARSSDTLTIVRAAEPVGGVSVAYAFTAGDRVEQRLTSGALGGELDRLDAAALLGAVNKSANYTVLASDISTLLRTSTASGTITITLPAISTLTDDFDVIIAKVSGDANTIAVTRSSTDTINGAAVYTLYTQFQSVWLIADRTTSTWTAVTAANSGANVVVDAFTGSGTAGPFTLSGDPVSKNNTVVIVGGTPQLKSTYDLSGTALTLGGVVTSGVLIEVWWTQPLVIGVPSDGSVSTAKIADLGVTTAKLAANAVTYAKMQSVTAGKLLGRDTSGAGVVQELPIAVDASGNVGIGTSLPQAKVEVYKSTSGSTAQVFRLTNPNTAQNTGAGIQWNLSSDNSVINGEISVYRGAVTSGTMVFKVTDPSNSALTERMRIDSAGQIKTTVAGGTSLMDAYACRTWVNFNGTGTVAIRSSGNVSSITDVGAGIYAVNFTTSMPDANFAVSGQGAVISGATAAGWTFGAPIRSTSAVRIQILNAADSGARDPDYVDVAIFR